VGSNPIAHPSHPLESAPPPNAEFYTVRNIYHGHCRSVARSERELAHRIDSGSGVAYDFANQVPESLNHLSGARPLARPPRESV